MAYKLSSAEECQFETLIDQSILDRYDGDLERGWDKDGPTYRPLDTDHVRTLLNVLWGELLAPQAIAFERLTQLGNRWPHGYCEEDEEERTIASYGPK
jgi:hypothetical protein